MLTPFRLPKERTKKDNKKTFVPKMVLKVTKHATCPFSWDYAKRYGNRATVPCLLEPQKYANSFLHVNVIPVCGDDAALFLREIVRREIDVE